MREEITKNCISLLNITTGQGVTNSAADAIVKEVTEILSIINKDGFKQAT